MMMGCARKVALSVSILWLLLLILSLADLNFRTRDSIIITVPSNKSIAFLKTMQNQKKSEVRHRNLNLNFVSKRRVPNGPDPIHNRKVGTTRLPPT